MFLGNDLGNDLVFDMLDKKEIDKGIIGNVVFIIG